MSGHRPGLYEASVRGALRAYKLTLSPYIGQGCRFRPTCSEYMADALIRRGPVTGLWLGVKRICRCRPGGGSGYDPVPDAPADRDSEPGNGT